MIPGETVSIVPSDGEDFFREFVAWELVLADVLGGPALVVHARVVGTLDFGRRFVDAEGREDGIENVATKVAKCPVAEILPVAPAPWMVDLPLDVWAFGSNAEPNVPSERFWDGCGGRSVDVAGLAVTSGGDPGVDTLDFTDGTLLDELNGGAVEGMRVNLVSHARDDFGLGRLKAHLARFPYVVGKRFLTKEVLPLPHAVEAHSRVHVVGYAHGHGVHFVTRLGEHFTVILEDGSIGVQLACLRRAGEIAVAEGDVLPLCVTGHGAQVGPTSSLGADGRELEGGVEIASPYDGGSSCD